VSLVEQFMAATTEVPTVSAMGLEEVQELIERAARHDVPLRVLFAALDRFTELTRADVVDTTAKTPTDPDGDALVHDAP
jgi:type III secretion system FlhB-like substrate exporter